MGDSAPVVDRAGCRPWCGHDHRKIVDLGPEVYRDWQERRGTYAAADFAYCSQACYNARVPPVAPAKPHVEVGQVWMFEGAHETIFDIDIDGDMIVTCQAGTKDGEFVHFGRGCCWRYRVSLQEGRLVSPAPEPAKAEAAKALIHRLDCCNCGSYGRPEHRRDHQCAATIRKPSTPATAERGPVCSECDKAAPNVKMRVTHEARELLCDICMTRKEEQVHDLMMFESTGKRYKGPTRLPRPAMAHSMGVEDPALEDC